MASDRKMAAVPATTATLESRLTALGKRFSAFPDALSRFRQESSREYLDTIPLRRTFEESYFRRIRRNGFGRQIFHR
jgi:hypothetical protein